MGGDKLSLNISQVFVLPEFSGREQDKDRGVYTYIFLLGTFNFKWICEVITRNLCITWLPRFLDLVSYNSVFIFLTFKHLPRHCPVVIPQSSATDGKSNTSPHADAKMNAASILLRSVS